MSEMFERVTKAILDEMMDPDGLDELAAHRYAKAAIEAMQEPTEQMCNEAGHTLETSGTYRDFMRAALGKVDA